MIRDRSSERVKSKAEFDWRSEGAIKDLTCWAPIARADGDCEAEGKPIVRLFFGWTVAISWWLVAARSDTRSGPWRVRAELGVACGPMGGHRLVGLIDVSQPVAKTAERGGSEGVARAVRSAAAILLRGMKAKGLVEPYEALRQARAIDASCDPARAPRDRRRSRL